MDIHFSHANGFTAGAYQQLFNNLNADFNLYYIEQFGDKPEYQVTDNWPNLVTQLVNNVEKIGQPVIGIGHSLGGVLTYMAAAEYPDLFKGIILLDSLILNEVKCIGTKFLKSIGQLYRVTPGGKQILYRKSKFTSIDSFKDYLKDKKLFKNFAPQCLDDYAKNSTIESDAGRCLKIPPEREYLIYNTYPHILPKFKNLLKIPCWVLVGNDTDVVTKSDQKYMVEKLGFNIKNVAGGHLFPFEYPDISAAEIKKIISLF